MEEIITFPHWMGVPVIDGYTVEPIDRRVKTEMEVGSVIRVEFPTDETLCTCSLSLNAVQAAWLETFEHTILNQGSKWMKMRLRTAGEINEHTVRFAERPKLSAYNGGLNTYTLKLELEKREGMMSEEMVLLLLEYDPGTIEYQGGRLQNLLNVDLPKYMAFAA